jgi:hypothetical protein
VSTSLADTSAAEINKALITVRRAHGGPTAGHVMTLVVAAEGMGSGPAVQATCRTAGEHPGWTPTCSAPANGGRARW